MRRGVIAAAGLSVLSLLGVAAVAPGANGEVTARTAPTPDPYGEVRNILPPGSNGTATALDLARVGPSRVASPTTPKNFADQLEIYDALTKKVPTKITSTDIDTLFKDASFTPEEVASTQTPRTDVTIERDGFGVPFITGTTFAGVEYGAGYAATQDRMFLMDVLRHTGQARLAEFAGNSPSNVHMDQQQLRLAYYTPAEAEAQVAKAAKDAGPDGPKLLTAIDSYLEGINDAQASLCPVAAAPSCPVEYAALQKTPTDWTRADVVYVASLVGGIFGKGGGGETANAAWLQQLVKKFGGKTGQSIYNDLREKNDSEAPVTSTIRTPYEQGKINPSLPGVALPDLNGPTASGTGDPVAGSARPTQPAAAALDADGVPTTIDLPSGPFSFSTQPHDMSNAILVDAKHSATGKPLAVMGPQTGYFAPQLLVEEVLKGPGIMARGVAFAGTNLFVQLGHGVDYAWSATSADSDNVDTVAEPLCNLDRSKATINSTAYLVGATCVPMDQAVHTETPTPNATAPGAPQTYEFLVLRTRHGIVQQRTTVKGKPVAMVAQRSTYGHEVDSVVGFGKYNDPGFVHDAKSFAAASGDIDFTFNWFYADSRDIGYYSSGLLPVRSKKVDSDLPHWAGKAYDWQGWLPFNKHVNQVNSPKGYFVSWNNKPAPGFGAADNKYSDGAVYRSLALELRLKQALRSGRGKVDLPALVGVMARAATTDTRARFTLPLLIKVIGKDPKDAAALRLLRSWVNSGADRVDRDRDGSYAHQAAIALFDDWWQHGRSSVAYDVLVKRLGYQLVRRLPQKLDDHPRQGLGSSWNGVAWYGYVNKELRSVLGEKVGSPYARGYCGNGKLNACRRKLRVSLRRAVAHATRVQGVSDVSKLTYDKTQDDIVSVTAGVVGVRPIDWQNRPTFQQTVSYLRRR